MKAIQARIGTALSAALWCAALVAAAGSLVWMLFHAFALDLPAGLPARAASFCAQLAGWLIAVLYVFALACSALAAALCAGMPSRDPRLPAAGAALALLSTGAAFLVVPATVRPWSPSGFWGHELARLLGFGPFACALVPFWLVSDWWKRVRRSRSGAVPASAPAAGERPAARGADPEVRDEMGRTMLQRAIADGRLEEVRLLLEQGADANAPGEGGWTPLHGAALSGARELVEALLAHGAHTDVRSDEERATPLHLAASRGIAEVVQVLLDHGADPAARDVKGRTPADVAAGAHATAVVEMLRRRSGEGGRG
jgi:hypothetical protein